MQEKGEMGLCLGGEKSIFQKEVHGGEMVEMEEMCIFKQVNISIL